MNQCDKYQELISRLVDGQLSRSEYARLKEHMEGCSECSAMYAVFASLSDIIGSEDEPLPEDLHENIMAGVRRSAMISRNRRRMSRPLRNSLAAAACAALVLFAARGLSPAEKAGSTMLTESDTVALEAQIEKSVAEPAAEAVEEAAATSPVQPAPAEPASPVPTAAPSAVPSVAPATEKDIYLDDEANRADKPIVVTVPPTPIVVQTPVTVHTPAPTSVSTPQPVTVTESPIVVHTAQPQPEAAAANGDVEAAAPAAIEESQDMPAYSGEASAEPAELPATEAPAVITETETVVTEEPEPTPTETPSLTKRMFAFFSMRPMANDDAPEQSEEPAELEQTTEHPAEESPEVSPVIEEKEAADTKPKIRQVKLSSLEKLNELEDMLDGKEETLPPEEAEKIYSFRLEKPRKELENYELRVYIYKEKIYYEQYFGPDEKAESCLAPCKTEDFMKLLATIPGALEPESSASPSPAVSPAASPAASVSPSPEQ